MDFGSLITAMVTPFDTSGALNEGALKPLVDHLIETGTTAIVAVGTTGESPTLSHAEKLRVFDATLRAVDGRIPVIAGTGTNSTKDSVELTLEAARLGVQGILLVAPYYNRPSQDGLYAHFATIAESTTLPVMIYNVPGRTGVNIQAETALQLAEIPNIVALKEASGDFTQILHIAAEKPDDFLLYSGDDKFTLPMLSIGAAGVVSVASHVVGKQIRTMMDLFWQGQTDEAAYWSGRLLPIFEAMFATASPAPVKEALSVVGMDVGSVRAPLLPASAALREHLVTLLNGLGVI
ncbi:dihydrodipicolinate synthase [Alicyclobacillus hesperidum URH17-3-68]|uniref:4-hydroxy-tetrahydrodipicolinate synthase n=1 Tax=Alicyclobacillus hesperidum TaxID=89784 RepID=A0A1H2SKB5_9BACL|nr:4-hydroxy-tetrahydrodipicolinate synthase [Alicyclobacillus hesperidum]EJY55586.1 dihydrodipicolinate synthase [Alicyclobacillus hesperidum URH17-3-68]GLG00618.1 4-hydroxy-tetrahydrodipicolinate synthase [Alicyclobacillus hesperidum subsp. aegles]GLV12418.1 4-hydroxy-tetrahydrodipicolinate synthase [Alicyclobacillus hesperidum]SDW31968.1 dihydrodipicolinate synthase [Alicyclobacillus hesperidum]